MSCVVTDACRALPCVRHHTGLRLGVETSPLLLPGRRRGRTPDGRGVARTLSSAEPCRLLSLMPILAHPLPLHPGHDSETGRKACTLVSRAAWRRLVWRLRRLCRDLQDCRPFRGEQGERLRGSPGAPPRHAPTQRRSFSPPGHPAPLQASQASQAPHPPKRYWKRGLPERVCYGAERNLLH